MTPEQRAAAPCKGRTNLFALPFPDDPGPTTYDERRAKALCALCPADTREACYEEGADDYYMIRAGLTPKERGNHHCQVCYGTDFDTVRHSETGKPTRRCSACHRKRNRKGRTRARNHG